MMLKKWYLSIVQIKDYKIIGLSVYLSAVLIMLANPIEKNNISVKTFDRVIGLGIANNIDIQKIIQNFYVWFILFIVLLILFLSLFNIIAQKKIYDSNIFAWEHLDTLMPIAYVALVLKGITYFYSASFSERVFDFGFWLLLMIVILDILYLTFSLEKIINYNNFRSLLISMFGISFSISICIFKEWNLGESWFYSYIVLVCISIFITYIISISKHRFENTNAIYQTLGISSFLFIITSGYIELINILNQYQIYVNSPKLQYIKGMVLITLLATGTYFILRRYKYSIDLNKYLYPALIFGLACLKVQLPLQQIGKYDIFESANYSILISDFLNYGKIPIIENYGGHMLTDVLGGILYGIVNNDYAGAIFSPYSVYIYAVLMLVFYYLLSKLLDEELAFWILLVLPVYNSIFYFGLGMILCLAIGRYLNKKTYMSATFIWICCTITVLYRLDLGVAFGVATVLTLLIYSVVTRDWENSKKLVIPFVVIIITGILTFFGLCIAKGIQPVIRLKEFIAISASNQNWAYGSIGDTANTVFSWSYVFIPFLCLLAMLYLLLHKEILDKVGSFKYCFLLLTGFAYFANFSRGLVRHSVFEMTLYVIVFCGFYFLAAFMACVFEKKQYFVYVLFAFLLVNNLLLQDTNYNEETLINGAVRKNETVINSWNTREGELSSWQKIDEKVDRIIKSEELEAESKPLQVIFDLFLDEDDTYLDFVNKSFLYSVLNRKSPVYVTQSPGHLSGEFTQEEFVNQIKENLDNIPIAIMPNSLSGGLRIELDGIGNSYRYYKVSEFIYQEYRPLCQIGDVAIWCRKGIYEEYKAVYETQLKNASEKASITLSTIEQLETNDSAITIKNGILEIESMGEDPYMVGLQDLFSHKIENELKYVLEIQYKFIEEGILNLYYTTELEESFSEEKMSTITMDDSGIAKFSFKGSEFMKLRLDIPYNGKVAIESITLVNDDFPKEINYDYEAENSINQHNYPLYQLPFIWGNYDELKAWNNQEVVEVNNSSAGTYFFDSLSKEEKVKGNYLLLSFNYEGQDDNRNDETGEISISLGNLTDLYEGRYGYTMTVHEGYHNYLIRISSDYFWYADEINGLKIYNTEGLNQISAKILIGD